MNMQTHLSAINERLSLALESSRQIAFDWHIPNDRLHFSGELADCFKSVALDTSKIWSSSALPAIIHDDDKERFHRYLHDVLKEAGTADGAFSAIRAGTDTSSDAALKSYNPYWRLALQHDWQDGVHSAMIGAYGLTVDRYPDNTMQSGPTDRFSDTGMDAQYQYITDRHRVSAQLNYIRERQHWDATKQSNPSDTLRSFRAKATYYYQKQYGITLGYFSIHGDSDDVLYNTGNPVTGSAGGSPNTSGFIWEMNYLPRRNIRFMLQYTAYDKFNGARTNYDGFGRNASDNNTLFLLGWFMF